MPISKDESFDLAPVQFIRGSKMRKSFRIRHRCPKLPPAAILFMKSLEHNETSKLDPIRSKSVFYTSAVEDTLDDSTSLNESFDFDPLADDELPLINKTPVLRRRNSFKKLPAKKKHKIDSIISFFRKVWRITKVSIFREISKDFLIV